MKLSDLIPSLILLSLKFLQKKLQPVAEFGDSSQLSVGEQRLLSVVPLGSEYANTVTQGIISSLNRNVSKI